MLKEIFTCFMPSLHEHFRLKRSNEEVKREKSPLNKATLPSLHIIRLFVERKEKIIKMLWAKNNQRTK